MLPRSGEAVEHTCETVIGPPPPEGVVAKHKRHGHKYRRKPLQPIKFQTELSLAGLVEDTATTVITTPALEHDFDIVSTDLLCAIRDQTLGVGPIEFGLAMQDYTGAEIVEALDATPLGPYGTEMERSRRAVRSYGQFAGEVTPEIVNDGLPICRRMFLRVAAGKSAADVFFINRDPTTKVAGVAEIIGVHWGRWR